MPLPSSCCTSCPDTELVNVPGVAGDDGADGADGISAYSTLASAITIPAVGSTTGAITVDTNAWLSVGQVVFASDGTNWGTFRVATKTGTTAVTLTFLGAGGDSAVGSIIASAGKLSPAGAPTALSGAVNPESQVVGSPGITYLNTTDESFWIKKTGTNTNTGWLQLIAPCLLFMLSLFQAVAAPPIVRSEYTTNYFTNASVYITNLVGWMNTNNAAFTNHRLAAIRWATTNDSTIINFSTNLVRWMMTNDSATTNEIIYWGKVSQTNNYSWNSNNVVAIATTNTTVLTTMTNAAKQGLSCLLYVIDDRTGEGTTNVLTFTGGILTATNRYAW